MIVVVALNPARDILVRVDELRPGEVHRTTTTVEVLGGKALNVVRFARLMGGSVCLILLADDALRDAVARDSGLSADPSGDALVVVPSSSPPRVDLAIVDAAGSATVVNGTARAPTAAAVAALEARTAERLGRHDVLVLAGSVPPATDGVLERLTRLGRERGATVIVDASGRWLAEALRGRPHIVKVNAAEAAGRSSGHPMSGGQAMSGRPAGFDGIDVLAVTDGADGLRTWVGGAAWRVAPPPGLEIVNTLAAGDAVTAGLAVGLADGRPVIDALRLGVAMAAARLRHFEISLDPRDVPGLERAVRVEPATG